MTLGLVCALDHAGEELRSYDWETLRSMREAACRNGFLDNRTGAQLTEFSLKMLFAARQGLLRRARGEETYLEPLEDRWSQMRCPADTAQDIYMNGNTTALVNAWHL